MKAAVITDFNQPPVIGEIADLILQPGEQRVFPRATAISQLVRAKASGLHYSSGTALPMVPGVDGVGLLENGDRVFFVFPRDGSMAEQAAVRSALCVPIPDDLDDISAAALANPGMSSIAALQYRASFNVGETVLQSLEAERVDMSFRLLDTIPDFHWVNDATPLRDTPRLRHELRQAYERSSKNAAHGSSQTVTQKA